LPFEEKDMPNVEGILSGGWHALTKELAQDQCDKAAKQPVDEQVGDDLYSLYSNSINAC
jgi:hypothetical protein